MHCNEILTISFEQIFDTWVADPRGCTILKYPVFRTSSHIVSLIGLATRTSYWRLETDKRIGGI